MRTHRTKAFSPVAGADQIGLIAQVHGLFFHDSQAQEQNRLVAAFYPLADCEVDARCRARVEVAEAAANVVGVKLGVVDIASRSGTRSAMLYSTRRRRAVVRGVVSLQDPVARLSTSEFR